MRTTFRQLEVLVRVHEDGGFSAAAETLGISQVAVSKHIAALERAVEQPLFERQRGSKAVLNAAGREMFRRALVVLEQAGGLSRAPRSAQIVRIAVDSSLLASVLRPALGSFLLTEPDIQITFVELEPGAAAPIEVVRSDVNLTYLTTGRRLPAGVGTILSEIPASLYISPRWPGAETWRNDLPTPLPIILAPSGSWLERDMRDSLNAGGLNNYRVVANVQHGESMRDLAVAGVGASLLSRRRAQPHVARGELLELTQAFGGGVVYQYLIRNPASNALCVDTAEAFFSGVLRNA